MAEIQDKTPEPVILLDRVRNMIFDIVDEVWDIVKTNAIEKPIAALQEEIGILKWNFPINYKNAATELEKVQLREDISALNKKVTDLKLNQVMTEVSFLHIKQGVQNTFNGIMAGYGVVAAVTPSMVLKGDGNIVIKADKDSKLYVSQAAEVGTPTPALINGLDEAEFWVKAGLKITKIGKNFAGLVQDGIELTNNEKAAKEAKAEKKQEKEEAEKAEKKAKLEAAKKKADAAVETAKKAEEAAEEAAKKAQETAAKAAQEAANAPMESEEAAQAAANEAAEAAQDAANSASAAKSAAQATFKAAAETSAEADKDIAKADVKKAEDAAERAVKEANAATKDAKTAEEAAVKAEGVNNGS